jgi:hypothetical protein
MKESSKECIACVVLQTCGFKHLTNK